jgi:hypothetical protein
MRISETEEYRAKTATYFICACGKGIITDITFRFIYTAKYEMNNWNDIPCINWNVYVRLIF